MSSCRNYVLRLNALLDGELDAAERTAVETHLSACRCCRDELKRLQEVRMMLGASELRYATPARLIEAVRDNVGSLADATGSTAG